MADTATKYYLLVLFTKAQLQKLEELDPKTMRASTAEERHVVTLLKSSGSATTDVVNICNNGGCLVVSRLELADPAVSVDTNYGSELFRLTDVTDPVTAKEWGRKHDALMSVYVSAHQLLLVTE